MKIRYTTTHINRDGHRVITGPNQGRYFKDTLLEAQEATAALVTSNAPTKLAEVYGPQSWGTFETRAIECYDNGDAKSIYLK